MDQNYESEKLEAQKRFDALPENLKKEMLADKNVKTVISICQDYSIPEEKVKHVALLVGEVFLGYIKPEEVAHELTTYFDIDLQKSNFIEIELKQKIFNSLKTELDKIYNPSPAEALLRPSEAYGEGGAKAEAMAGKEEVSPSIIKFEAEKQVKATEPSIKIEASQQQKTQELTSQQPIISPLTIENIPGQPAKTVSSTTSKTILEPTPKEEAPFIIQTHVEAVKPVMPQFSKGAPSLNLKVDPSIIQKVPEIKPISVRLETTQPVQEKKFQMPVIAGQKIFSSAPQTTPIIPQATQQSKIEIKPIQTKAILESKEINLQGKPIEPQKTGAPQVKTATPIFETIKIPIQQKVITNQPQIASTLSLKQISEQKIAPPEPTPSTDSTSSPQASSFDKAQDKSGQAKVVHYSTFKTDLTHPSLAGALGGQTGQAKAAPPKAGEPRPATGREEFINLNTFMKVSGNTIDLRKSD